MLGSLGLIRHLQGVALSGAASDLQKRLKRLRGSAKDEADSLIKQYREAQKVGRERHQGLLEELLYRLGEPKRLSSEEVKTAKRVVGAFLLGRTDKAGGIEATPTSLTVKGKEVMSRSSNNFDKVRVCPGKFGEDALSRKAANAALDILGAGLGVSDREGSSFLAAGGRGGRVYSPNACYDVQVNSRLAKAAARGAREDYESFWSSSQLPEAKVASRGGMSEQDIKDLTKYYADKSRREARRPSGSTRDMMYEAGSAIDGLRRMKRRKSRKSR